jgi:hypothetical protein
VIKSYFNQRPALVGTVQRIAGIAGPGVGFTLSPGGEYPTGYYPLWCYVDGDRGNRLLITDDRPVWVDGGFRFLDFDYLFASGSGTTKPTRTTTAVPKSTWDIHVLGARGDAFGAPSRPRRAMVDLRGHVFATGLIPTTQPGQATDGWAIGPNWKSITFAADPGVGADLQVWIQTPPCNGGDLDGDWYLDEEIEHADLFSSSGTLTIPITRDVRIPGAFAHSLAAADSPATAVTGPRIAFRTTGGAAGDLYTLLAEVEF